MIAEGRLNIDQYKILCGDVIKKMQTLPDLAIHCIITSPPYWQKRDYSFKGQWGLEKTIEQYLANLQNFMQECKRVLREDGTVFINLGDTYHNPSKWTNKKEESQIINYGNNRDYATQRIIHQGLPEKCLSLIPDRFAIQCINNGWTLRNDIIWAKPNAVPESIKDRFSTRYEHIFFLTKNGKYYFDLDAIREKYSQATIERNWYGKSEVNNKRIAVNRKIPPGDHLHPKGKNPGDVTDFWKITTKDIRDNHYAGFNTELITKPILAGCPKGKIVLDPFCGRGTTGIAAIELGKKFIGIDAKRQYCDMAKTNCKQAVQARMPKLKSAPGLASPLEGLDYINMKTPITYYGGKQRLVGLILSLIPKHKLYCEPFAGGAAVFFAKEKSEMEVINDLNGDVVNFYQVCKTDFTKLEKLIQSTPNSRKIYTETKEILKNQENHNKIKRAWAFWVQTNMSYAAKLFGGYAERLDWVSIEYNDALQVIKSRDTSESFFYCDPPYFNSEIGPYKGYLEKDFNNLLELLSSIKGQFLLSSYPSNVLTRHTQKNKWSCYSLQKFVSVDHGNDKVKVKVLTANYDINTLLKKNQRNATKDNLTGFDTRTLQMKARGLKLGLQLK